MSRHYLGLALCRRNPTRTSTVYYIIIRNPACQ